MNTATHAYTSASIDQSRERLILDNLVYVRKILSTLTVGLSSGYDRENLEQAGMVGLIKAADGFDPKRGISFRTFSFPRIRGAIVDEMRKNSPIPQQMQVDIGRLKRAQQAIEGPASPELLASTTGMTINRIQQVLEAMRFSSPESWDDLFSNIHNSWKKAEDQPDAAMQNRELKKVIADCIEELPKRERLVLTLYYTEDLTLAEIGRVADISEATASRALASATFRLQELVGAKL